MINKRKIIIGLFCTLAIFAGLEIAGVTHVFIKDGPRSNFPVTTTHDGASATTQKGPKTNTSATTPSSSAAVPPASDATKAPSNSTASTTLISPSGNFVSNHTPGQHNSPQTEASVCNTTSGAKCQIIFTNGSSTLSLPAEITDSNGSAYWNDWTPASLGLTAGSWHVKAVATLDKQTKTTEDPMDLVVQ